MSVAGGAGAARWWRAAWAGVAVTCAPRNACRRSPGGANLEGGRAAPLLALQRAPARGATRGSTAPRKRSALATGTGGRMEGRCGTGAKNKRVPARTLCTGAQMLPGTAQPAARCACTLQAHAERRRVSAATACSATLTSTQRNGLCACSRHSRAAKWAWQNRRQRAVAPPAQLHAQYRLV